MKTPAKPAVNSSDAGIEREELAVARAHSARLAAGGALSPRYRDSLRDLPRSESITSDVAPTASAGCGREAVAAVGGRSDAGTPDV